MIPTKKINEINKQIKIKKKKEKKKKRKNEYVKKKKKKEKRIKQVIIPIYNINQLDK